MSANDKKDYTDVLLEDMNSKMDAVVEAVGQIQDQVKALPAMQKDIEEIKNDVKVTKVIGREHEQRITSLEAAKA